MRQLVAAVLLWSLGGGCGPTAPVCDGGAACCAARPCTGTADDGRPLVCHPSGVCLPCGTWGGTCCADADGGASCGAGLSCERDAGLCNFSRP